METRTCCPAPCTTSGCPRPAWRCWPCSPEAFFSPPPCLKRAPAQQPRFWPTSWWTWQQGSTTLGWTTDGNASTPVFGSQIDAFQGHHRRPWTITKRGWANNLHALARPTFFTTVILWCLPLGPAQDVFAAAFFTCVMLSQLFHAWAHTPKPLLPQAVIALQDAKLLVSRKMHGAHHRPPFSANYCIVSGLANAPLDGLGVFTALEKLIFKSTGIPPRSWSVSAQEMLSGDVAYYEDGTNIAE